VTALLHAPHSLDRPLWGIGLRKGGQGALAAFRDLAAGRGGVAGGARRLMS